jgi:uncharacterized protein (TIGR02118 family)
VIHQLIFAAPKPGMSDEEFQRYWLDVHAVRYASKIPQIKKYLIDTTVPFGPDNHAPPWRGAAEIWLENQEDELASLQTREFIDGARADEPNWAAFWLTLALSTDAHELVAGPPLTADPHWVKVILLVKRKQGLSLPGFRRHSLGGQAELARQVPGLRRYLQCHTRDALYGIGEAPLDAAYQLWFDDLEALADALSSPEFKRVDEDMLSFVEPRYIHRMITHEHWVIGPDTR